MEKCPLTGKPCSKPKSIHITDLNENAVTDTHLCEECGINYSKNILHVKLPSITPSSLDSLINLIDNITNLDVSVVHRKCTCGSTYKNIVEKSRFGCAKCYTTFRELAIELFGRCQDGLKHTGKVPSTWEDDILNETTKEKIRKLKEKIRKAVEIENYEVAAELKKMIEDLENPKGNYDI